MKKKTVVEMRRTKWKSAFEIMCMRGEIFVYVVLLSLDSTWHRRGYTKLYTWVAVENIIMKCKRMINDLEFQQNFIEQLEKQTYFLTWIWCKTYRSNQKYFQIIKRKTVLATTSIFCVITKLLHSQQQTISTY